MKSITYKAATHGEYYQYENNGIIMSAGEIQYVLEASINEAEEGQEIKQRVKAIFVLAGIDILGMWELSDQYIRDRRWPWWLIKTHCGLIKIGWRKRVINIDWSDTEIAHKATEDNVTTWDYGVHAYSEEKAIEYLKSFGKILNVRKPL